MPPLQGLTRATVHCLSLSGNVLLARSHNRYKCDMVQKDEKMFVRCTASQKTAWEQAAALDRRDLSDWVRIQLDDAANRAIQAAEKKA